MSKLFVGDLAIYTYLPDIAEAIWSKWDKCIVEITMVEDRDWMRWEYEARFPDGTIWQVSADELEPVFSR